MCTDNLMTKLIEEQLIAVGSEMPSHGHTELLDRRSVSWVIGQDYPFSTKIDGFAVLSISDFFVVFGGQVAVGSSNTETEIIAQYKGEY